MKVDKIVPWEKVGVKTIVTTRQDKYLTCQYFKNPLTGEIRIFYGYTQSDWSIILPITDDGEIIEVIIERIEDWILKVFTEIREAPSREATFLALPWLRREFGINVNKIVDLAFSKRTKGTAITSRS